MYWDICNCNPRSVIPHFVFCLVQLWALSTSPLSLLSVLSSVEQVADRTSWGPVGAKLGYYSCWKWFKGRQGFTWYPHIFSHIQLMIEGVHFCKIFHPSWRVCTVFINKLEIHSRRFWPHNIIHVYWRLFDDFSYNIAGAVLSAGVSHFMKWHQHSSLCKHPLKVMVIVMTVIMVVVRITTRILSRMIVTMISMMSIG